MKETPSGYQLILATSLSNTSQTLYPKQKICEHRDFATTSLIDLGSTKASVERGSCHRQSPSSSATALASQQLTKPVRHRLKEMLMTVTEKVILEPV